MIDSASSKIYPHTPLDITAAKTTKSIDCSQIICSPLKVSLELDPEMKEPLSTKRTFKELIDLKATEKKAYLLAMVVGERSSILSPIPCDAHILNQRLKREDVTQTLPIDKVLYIAYFKLSHPEDSDFTFSGICKNWKEPSPHLKFTLAKNMKNGAERDYRLSRCYAKGIGTKKNNSKALKFLTLSANENYLKAQSELAKHFYYVVQEIDKAVELMQKASLQNCPKAQCSLALHHMSDKGTKNHTEAARLLKLSTEQEYLPAFAPLASLYFIGEGVPQDIEKALDLYTKGVKKGCLTSQLFLAGIYQHGKNVTKNIHLAKYYYTLASKQHGSMVAKAALDELNRFTLFQ